MPDHSDRTELEFHEKWFHDGINITPEMSTCFKIKSTDNHYGRAMPYNERYKRHKFDKVLLRQIATCLESNNYRGVVQVIEDWIVVALTAYISYSVYIHNYNIFTSILVYVLSTIVIGARQRAIAIKLHAAAHGSLAKNHYLNITLGTIFSGYTMFQSLSLYTKTHCKEHHPWIGNPHRDPDYQGFIEYNICGEYRSSHKTRAFMNNIFSVQNAIQYIKFLVYNRIYNKKEHLFECYVRIMYWFCLLCVVLRYELWTLITFYWLVPLLTTHLWIGSFLELCEHYPMVDIANEYLEYKDIFLTKNRIADPLTNFILGIHYEGYDLVHHLFPKVPTWNYPKIHNILMNDEVYRKLDHGTKGWLHIAKQIIVLSDLDRN